MKVGMIFECGPDGADKKVCEHLTRRIKSDIEIESVTLNNKPNLISECGRAAGSLFIRGCEKVVIIWDLFPPWRGKDQKPCRQEDREMMIQSLEDAGVSIENVHLVCITEELEAWLIADGRALSKVLSTTTRKVDIPDRKKPEQVRNPKKVLTKLFYEKTGKPYVDRTHAEKIAKALPSLNRLQKYSPSFLRFSSRLEN